MTWYSSPLFSNCFKSLWDSRMFSQISMPFLSWYWSLALPPRQGAACQYATLSRCSVAPRLARYCWRARSARRRKLKPAVTSQRVKCNWHRVRGRARRLGYTSLPRQHATTHHEPQGRRKSLRSRRLPNASGGGPGVTPGFRHSAGGPGRERPPQAPASPAETACMRQPSCNDGGVPRGRRGKAPPNVKKKTPHTVAAKHTPRVQSPHRPSTRKLMHSLLPLRRAPAHEGRPRDLQDVVQCCYVVYKATCL